IRDRTVSGVQTCALPIWPGIALGVDRVKAGDKVIVSGTIGDHGIAVLSAREGLDFGGEVASDTAPLHRLVASLLDENVNVRFLRSEERRVGKESRCGGRV